MGIRETLSTPLFDRTTLGVNGEALDSFARQNAELVGQIDRGNEARETLASVLVEAIRLGEQLDERSHGKIAADLGISAAAFARALQGHVPAADIVGFTNDVTLWLRTLV